LDQAAKKHRRELKRIGKLAKKARKGDRAAFDGLVDLFWADIYRLIFFRISHQMDAEDLAQEVFLKAYRNIDSLSDPERFKSWLYSIALNQITDHYRRKNVRSVVGDFGEDMEAPARAQMALQGEGTEEMVGKREMWSEIKGFRDALPDSEQEVFTMRFMDGLDIREIAEILNKSQSAVKTHLYRAVAKLKKDKGLLRVLRGEA
jgi:RNA polymerase sigma-70 factor (ECF subfamily)